MTNKPYGLTPGGREGEAAGPALDEESNVRMSVRYRALNKPTVKGRLPLSHPEDPIARLHGMRRFTKLDSWPGFHKHRCHPDVINKTAFIGPDARSLWIG